MAGKKINELLKPQLHSITTRVRGIVNGFVNGKV
jgi:hypothetical protein